jgi:hypothetical protein
LYSYSYLYECMSVFEETQIHTWIDVNNLGFLKNNQITIRIQWKYVFACCR